MNRDRLTEAESIVRDLAGEHRPFVSYDDDDGSYWLCTCSTLSDNLEDLIENLDSHDYCCLYRRAVEYIREKEARC